MFVREKRIGPYTYVYLVETVREDGKTKQRIIKNLGRKEAVAARGDLDRLARSAARLARRSMILSLVDGGTVPELTCKRIGPPKLFERLWRDTGIRAVLDGLLGGRRFEFAVERAVFLTVLHRLMVSGSDRSCEAWRDGYRIDGVVALGLHHLYRAMAWLGEELAADGPPPEGSGPQGGEDAATPLAPRCIKDRVEEDLFARRRDLFSDLSVVFMDTTSLSFAGAGGETLGRHGYSKDHRPDLKQMILGVVIDQDGRPVCSEMWPGDTADVTTLIPVIDRLRERFGIGRVCVVADRGMISKDTMAALEERRLEYVLGVRERSSKEVREVVLADTAPMVTITVPRQKRPDTELQAKEVRLGEVRYIVCRNPAEAANDAAEREEIVASLRAALARGDKALVGNTGYRRYLKTPEGPHFEIDAARIADDARFDGLFVLRTNTTLDPLAVMLRYRELLMVEQVFRTAKSLLATRPIYHQSDAAIRGHVFCSFLALVLRKELDERLAEADLKPEWAELLRDLDRLQEVEAEHEGKRFILRTPSTGVAGKVFQAVGVALPPNIREAESDAGPA